MIEVKDNFLPKKIFKGLQDFCLTEEFKIFDSGDKQFSVLMVPNNIVPFLQKEGHKIILSFIRRAWKDFDTDLRAHCDGIIAGHQTSLASVLYINKEEGITPNGTCFYSHEIHGESFPENESEDEFNRLLLEDSNSPEKWIKLSEVFAKPNRFLTYEASHFHGKFPRKIEKGERQVLVTFYRKL